MATLNGDNTSNSLIGDIDALVNDALYGFGGDDVLLGLSGNDFLDGGAGADAMAGGTGDDTYVVDDLGDVVTEAANAGNDLVLSTINHVLGANVERLR